MLTTFFLISLMNATKSSYEIFGIKVFTKKFNAIVFWLLNSLNSTNDLMRKKIRKRFKKKALSFFCIYYYNIYKFTLKFILFYIISLSFLLYNDLMKSDIKLSFKKY